MEKTISTKYFTADDIDNFRLYATATTQTDKDNIYNRKLYKFIDFQIVVVMDWLNGSGCKNIIENYEDIKMDLHIHILTKVLPIINVKKVQAIQNLLHISIKNALINILKSMESKYKIKIDNNEFRLDDYEVEEEEEEAINIWTVIDDRLEELKSMQPTNTCVTFKYLTHLQDYIKDNDYDSAGFKEYCMDKMKIGNSQFHNLSSRIGIKTIAFKNKKIN